jgi:hypothetical protein
MLKMPDKMLVKYFTQFVCDLTLNDLYYITKTSVALETLGILIVVSLCVLRYHANRLILLILEDRCKYLT